MNQGDVGVREDCHEIQGLFTPTLFVLELRTLQFSPNQVCSKPVGRHPGSRAQVHCPSQGTRSQGTDPGTPVSSTKSAYSVNLGLFVHVWTVTKLFLTGSVSNLLLLSVSLSFALHTANRVEPNRARPSRPALHTLPRLQILFYPRLCARASDDTHNSLCRKNPAGGRSPDDARMHIYNVTRHQDVRHEP